MNLHSLSHENDELFSHDDDNNLVNHKLSLEKYHQSIQSKKKRKKKKFLKFPIFLLNFSLNPSFSYCIDQPQSSLRGILSRTKTNKAIESKSIDSKSIIKPADTQQKISFKPRFQARVQTVLNFFKRRSNSRNNCSENSNSADKLDRKNNTTSKFSSKISKGKNFLWIVFFVKKFVEIIKSYNIHQKLMRLTEYHYQLINDKSFFYSLTDLKTSPKGLKKPFHDLWERTKRNQRIIRQFQAIKRVILLFYGGSKGFFEKYVKVFSPEHTIRIFWDFLLLFSLIVNIFYIPLTIGFEIQNDYLHFEVDNIIFNILPNFVFMMDMIINMNTAYYSKGDYVQKRKKIFKNYLRSYFFIDSITIGPVLLHWISSSLFWMREIDIFSIFRLLKIQQLILKMNEYLHLESKAQGLLNLLKLLFINLFVAHICGCCWNYIGNFQNERFYYDNWLVKNNMIDSSLIRKYITCF